MSVGGAAPTSPTDRLERESIAFRQRVEHAYNELAHRSPSRFVSVDATLPPDTIARQIAERVEELCP